MKNRIKFGKKYNGKLAHVTLYRQLLTNSELAGLQEEFPDILTDGNYVFFFKAYEAQPVERRFGLLERFSSSLITRIDRQAGEIATLRRWWKVLVPHENRIAKNRPEIDLQGPDWKPADFTVDYLDYDK